MNNLISRAMPLLNKLVPSALAIKGLSKIDSRMGSFIQSALASGYTTDNVLEFLRSSIQSPGDKREMQSLESMSQSGNIHPEQQRSLQNRQSQEAIGKGISGLAGLAGGLAGMDKGMPSMNQPQQSQQPQSTQQNQPIQPPPIPEMEQEVKQPINNQQKNPLDFISGYFPELSDFLMQHIKDGRQPEEAAALAKLPGKYEKYVKSIEKDTGENFVDLISRLFGRSNVQQQAQTQQMQQQAQQQPGNSDAALMAALDKILKM